MDDNGRVRGKKEGGGELWVVEMEGGVRASREPSGACERCVNPENPPRLTLIDSFCFCSAGEVVALVWCSSLVCDCMFLYLVRCGYRVFDVAIV